MGGGWKNEGTKTDFKQKKKNWLGCEKMGGWKIGRWRKSGIIEEILISPICVWLAGGNVEGYKLFWFGWEEKWEDEK